MSKWTDLEKRVNPSFTGTFGGDPVSYLPAGSPTNLFPMVLVSADPEDVEGFEPAYCHAWAPADLFPVAPQAGDRIVVADGREFVVFAVHGETMDGALEPQTYWLSLNLA